jgi:hypothetical protein
MKNVHEANRLVSGFEHNADKNISISDETDDSCSESRGLYIAYLNKSLGEVMSNGKTLESSLHYSATSWLVLNLRGRPYPTSKA